MRWRGWMLLGCLAAGLLGGRGLAKAPSSDPGADLAAGLPGIGPQNDRRVVDVDAAPWRILGRVQTSLGGRCTGFAVAPTVLVTAAHCLWLRTTGHYIQPADVHVLMGYRLGRYRMHAQVTHFVIAPGYDPLNEGRTASEDRATLILDRPVARTQDLVPYGDAILGAPAMLVGYPQDRAEIPYGDISCHINGLNADGLIRHDCSATRGDSGGPLMVRQADGGWALAGIDVLALAGRGGFAAPLPH